MSTFNYLGEDSDEFGLRINDGVTFVSPENDIEYVEVKGYDGDIPIDNERLKTVIKPVKVTMFPTDGETLSEQVSNISNWLKSSKKYSELIFSNDDEYTYLATCYEQYNVDQLLIRYGEATINFKMMPYKFLASGLFESQLKSTITNTTNRIAKPKLTIKGSGNVTVKIGDSVLTVKGMDGGCVIDTLYSQATSLDGSRAIWDKVTTWPLPTIAPGKQTVTVTGNVTDIRIIPRWEVIVG